MTLLDIQKKFMDEVKYVDDTSQIVLKGHLVIEDLMTQAIESFVLHGENVEKIRLQFHQKVELCKAISHSDQKNNMWNLIKQLNSLRNALSHSLDEKRREKAILSLHTIYNQEFATVTFDIDGMSEEASLCMLAVTGALGFLHSFLSEIHRFDEAVQVLDKIINTKITNDSN